MFEVCQATSIKNAGFVQLLSQFLMESGTALPEPAAFERLETAVRQDRIRFFMALGEHGRVIGVVSLTFGFATNHMQSFGLLRDLYVHPSYRGQGAAARLVLAAMDGAHAEGAAYVITETGEGMEGIFERFGWAAGGRTLRYDVDNAGPPPSLTITGEITFD